MTVQQVTDEVITKIKNHKEGTARNNPSDAPMTDADIASIVHVYRGAHCVAVIFGPPACGTEANIALAFMGAAAFGADTLALTVESWAVTTPINPVTGEEWRHGEMQQVVDEHEGVEKGWIQAQLSTSVINRADDWRMVGLPYDLDRSTPILEATWGEELSVGSDDGSGATVEGRILDGMQQAMSDTTFTMSKVEQDLMKAGIMPPGWHEWSVTRRLAFNDLLAVRAVQRAVDMQMLPEGVAVMLQASDEERATELNEMAPQVLSDMEQE